MAVETTEQVSYGMAPLGASSKDLETVIKQNVEQFTLLYPRIGYRTLNRTNSTVDPLYREAVPEDKYFDKEVLVPALVIFAPQQKLLKKYGIEEEHAILCILNNRILNSLRIEARTGDTLAYLGTHYEVLTSKQSDYFASTQTPLNTILTLRQLNPR